MPFTALSRFAAGGVVAGTLLTSAACRGKEGSAGGAPPQAPPPTTVTIATLEQKPIEQTSEFIATVRSLRSTTVQPEVDGLVTRIFVKSGDRVRAGAPLVRRLAPHCCRDRRSSTRAWPLPKAPA
jgi:multidrug efflux pump subunit AcrA (membrane-fusion protein)